jgi:hypothetical protein
LIDYHRDDRMKCENLLRRYRKDGLGTGSALCGKYR